MPRKWQPTIPILCMLFFGTIAIEAHAWAAAWGASAFLLLLCTGEVITAIKEKGTEMADEFRSIINFAPKPGSNPMSLENWADSMLAALKDKADDYCIVWLNVSQPLFLGDLRKWRKQNL